MNRIVTTLVACMVCLNGAVAPPAAWARPASEPAGAWRYAPGGGIRWQDPARGHSVRLAGLLQLDSAFFHSDRRDLPDDTDVRRARLSLGGTIAENWLYRAEADFTDADPTLIELSVRRRRLGPGSVAVGYLKEPFGLEWQNSSRTLVFMERSLPNAFVPLYHLGTRADMAGRNWSASVGLFGGSVYRDDPPDGKWGASARATYAPRHSRRHVLHFGLAFAHREAESADGVVEFSPDPESTLAPFALVNTREIRHVDAHQLLGLEFAGVEGPWSWQSEYIRKFVDRDGRRANLAFDGWYVMGSWTLTGESRRYDVRQGEFRGIRPRHPVTRGGVGAWELATRYSVIDLNDDFVDGGEERNVTVALNWYPVRMLRVMANVIFVSTDANSLGRRNRGEEDPEIFQLRGQLEF